MKHEGDIYIFTIIQCLVGQGITSLPSGDKSRHNVTIHSADRVTERCGSVVVSTPVWHVGDLGSIPGPFKDCISLCLSDETLKAVGPFYLVSNLDCF